MLQLTVLMIKSLKSIISLVIHLAINSVVVMHYCCLFSSKIMANVLLSHQEKVDHAGPNHHEYEDVFHRNPELVLFVSAADFKEPLNSLGIKCLCHCIFPLGD